MVMEVRHVEKCPNCGVSNPENLAYCHDCGFRFSTGKKNVPLPAGVLLITFFQITGSFVFLLYGDLSGSLLLIMANVLLIALGILFFMRFSIARWLMVIIFPVLLFFMARDSLLIIPRFNHPALISDVIAAVLAILAFVYLLTPGVSMYFDKPVEEQ